MFDFLKKKSCFEDLDICSDYHCHVLPCVDDGSQSIEESLLMLRRMSRLGIKRVVLTPHINPDVYQDTNEQLINTRFKEFIATVPDDVKSGLEISLGAEYMVTQNFEKRDLSQLMQFVPGKVLIEMSYLYPSANIEEAIFNLVMAGLQPVIAHPERYLYYANKFSEFERFYDMGASFQINLLSLSGAYGKVSVGILKKILDNGWYSYMGSDAHSAEHLARISAMKFDQSLLQPFKKI